MPVEKKPVEASLPKTSVSEFKTATKFYLIDAQDMVITDDKNKPVFKVKSGSCVGAENGLRGNNFDKIKVKMFFEDGAAQEGFVKRQSLKFTPEQNPAACFTARMTP